MPKKLSQTVQDFIQRRTEGAAQVAAELKTAYVATRAARANSLAAQKQAKAVKNFGAAAAYQQQAAGGAMLAAKLEWEKRLNQAKVAFDWAGKEVFRLTADIEATEKKLRALKAEKEQAKLKHNETKAAFEKIKAANGKVLEGADEEEAAPKRKSSSGTINTDERRSAPPPIPQRKSAAMKDLVVGDIGKVIYSQGERVFKYNDGDEKYPLLRETVNEVLLDTSEGPYCFSKNAKTDSWDAVGAVRLLGPVDDYLGKVFEGAKGKRVFRFNDEEQTEFVVKEETDTKLVLDSDPETVLVEHGNGFWAPPAPEDRPRSRSTSRGSSVL